MKYQFKYFLKYFFMIALVMMLISCSLKTIYNQLDNFIPLYVESMVSMDSILEEKVAQRAKLLIQWHRGTQLKQYVERLRNIQGDVNGKLTEEKIQKHISVMYDFWKSISLRLNEEMVLLLPLLNKEQREELFYNIADKNSDFKEEYVDINKNERKEKYTENITNNYEKWLGELTEAQKDSVKKYSAQLQSTADYRLQRRMLWQDSIKRILKSKINLSQKTTALREFFSEYSNHVNDEFEAILDENIIVFSKLTLKIVQSMTNEQISHFMMTTNDYIRMFDELAKTR